MSWAQRLETFNRTHLAEPVSVARDRDCFEVSLSGELDMQISNEVTPLLDEVLQECSEGARLVLDLSRVTYIASMGVGLLASLLAKAERQSVSLVLRDVPPRVREIMEILGLFSFFVEERSEGGS